jgi:hypothetical protein
MKQEFPNLTGVILPQLLVLQTGTNSPLLAEFRQTLSTCVADPASFPKVSQFIRAAAFSGYDWCMKNKMYSLTAEIMLAKAQVAPKDLDCWNLLFPERTDHVRLLYAYAREEKWREALLVCEGLGDYPVVMDFEGPWGKGLSMFQPRNAAATLRDRLHLPPLNPTNIFEFPTNQLCMHTPSSREMFEVDPASFQATEDGLWLAIGGKLLHLDLDLRTNLQVALPVPEDTPLVSLCLSPDHIWVGTRGAGVIACDKSSSACRSFTQANGLLQDDITCLFPAGDNLWIGSGNQNLGGLARLDFATDRVSALTPSLPADPVTRVSGGAGVRGDDPNGPPSHPVQALMQGRPGELWLSVAQHGVRCYHPGNNSWTPLPLPDWPQDRITAIAVNSDRIAIGSSQDETRIGVSRPVVNGGHTNYLTYTNLTVTSAEADRFINAFRALPGVRVATSIHSFRLGGLAAAPLSNTALQPAVGTLRLPAPPTALLLDGSDLWVGGEGYIALFDPSGKSLRKISYISAHSVERLQIAAGYLWAEFDRHLHRVALSTIR